jgi:hypothetical protein
MDPFEKQCLWQAELRATQLDRAAQQAQAQGWPVKAAQLRHEATLAYEIARDVQAAADWHDEKQTQRPPL